MLPEQQTTNAAIGTTAAVADTHSATEASVKEPVPNAILVLLEEPMSPTANELQATQLHIQKGSTHVISKGMVLRIQELENSKS